MRSPPISINHPDLERLKWLNQEAGMRFNRPYIDDGFCELGLRIGEIGSYRYHCTPGNCYSFANTGGEGVHFSFMVMDGVIAGNSPVVITNPASMGMGDNFVVGEDLYEFLCLGFYRGYFALEQLAYDFDLTARVYTDPTWQPTEAYHDSVGYTLDDRQQRILDFLVENLGLKPWKSPARFKELEAKYFGLLTKPLDEE